ncbi:MAG: hypothetical protein K9W46_07840 [Candidatus Heimdallarchaeum endolithica]|uniref:Uncharacterized protein n=1 Tax=Candidatus Heimdallarchaeum endolithica TaxID=2876572 RepID=A0A9Y1BNU9_9ARCH|nr:MAG: hypothetical protein K9W46_07840 [Candidatus Heimdallarchaeum endolithica]
MLGRRILRSFVGFVTCTLVVVLIMFILWPTIDIIPLVEAHDYLVDRYGFGGHFFTILLMLLIVNLFIPFKFNLPIGFLPMFSELNIDQSFAIGNKFGNAGLYFLILGIWLVGSFAGGLVSRGGLRAGSTSATLSFIFLDVVFSIMAVSFDWNIAGISGFLLFFVMFFFTLVIGSFVFVGIIGLIGGGIGGILGKMLFTKDTKDKKE